MPPICATASIENVEKRYVMLRSHIKKTFSRLLALEGGAVSLSRSGNLAA